MVAIIKVGLGMGWVMRFLDLKLFEDDQRIIYNDQILFIIFYQLT